MQENFIKKILNSTDEEIRKMLDKVDYDKIAASITETTGEVKEKILRNVPAEKIPELFDKTEALLKKGQEEVSLLKEKAVEVLNNLLK